MAHVHAALMLQYAQDAAETDAPWERWETSESKTKVGDEWVDDWVDLTENPDWNPSVGYRRKSKVRHIGGIEIPAPLQKEPDMGRDYYYLAFRQNPKAGLHEFMVCVDVWRGRTGDFRRLLGNICHLSHKDAQTHADVLNAICRGECLMGLYPKVFGIDVLKPEDDIKFEVQMNPNEMRELANRILRNASIQEAVLAIRKINSELPRVYRQIGEYGLAKIYLGEVPVDGLDQDAWEKIRMQIEKGIENGTQR